MDKLELGNGTGNLESSPYAKFTEEVGIMYLFLGKQQDVQILQNHSWVIS